MRALFVAASAAACLGCVGERRAWPAADAAADTDAGRSAGAAADSFGYESSLDAAEPRYEGGIFYPVWLDTTEAAGEAADMGTKEALQDATEAETFLACTPGEKTSCATTCISIGTRACLYGVWGNCIPPSEICNNCKDDDCDGQIDEVCGPEPQCKPTEVCCNGADDDMDGATDENCGSCDKEPCDCCDNDDDGETDEGCGLQAQLFCSGKDDCNCSDDDGDWLVDEDCGVCGEPIPFCPVDGCDCKDNDKDGKIDEDCQCVPGSERWCEDPVYVNWGKQTCQANEKWGACEESPPPPECASSDPWGDSGYYSADCCVGAGYCCQNTPLYDSVGECVLPWPIANGCGADICDCKDNDKDGKTDEDCQCMPTQMRWCPVLPDETWGQQICGDNEMWGPCLKAAQIPQGCPPFESYDTQCCVTAGGCCQSGLVNESVGYCFPWGPETYCP